MDRATEIAGFALGGLVLVASMFFWGRGMRKGKKSDLLAGPAILLVLCAVLFLLVGNSGVFELIGPIVAIFGICTLALSPFAGPNCPLVKRDRLAIGAGVIILGLVLSTIM